MTQSSLGKVFVLSALWPLLACSLVAKGAETAPSSVRVASAPEKPTPLEEAHEVFVRILAVDAAKSEMTVSLRQQELRVSVSVANAGLFKPDSYVRGFLLPPPGTDALPLLDNLWPADSPVVEAQETALKKLTTLLKDPSFRIGTGFPLPLEGFLDQHAKVISNDRFRGKQVVINFIYGRCADPAMCPATAIRMTRLRDRLPPACRDKVEIVFITLDPQFDTPARCLEYLEARNANVRGVTMLTGSHEAIQALSKLCGVWFKASAEGVFEHAQTMLWVDATGTMREAFPSSDPGVTSLENALLLETSEPGVPSITQ